MSITSILTIVTTDYSIYKTKSSKTKSLPINVLFDYIKYFYNNHMYYHNLSLVFDR